MRLSAFILPVIPAVLGDLVHGRWTAQVGAVWAARSSGGAVFAMLFKQERGMDLRQQIDAALG